MGHLFSSPQQQSGVSGGAGNSSSQSDSLLSQLTSYKYTDDEDKLKQERDNLKNALCEFSNGSSVMGGSELELQDSGGVHGGYDEVQNYGDTVFSKAKEKLIRDIGVEVFSALKLPGAAQAKTAPIGLILKHLSTVVGDLKKGKGSKHGLKNTCNVLGNAINKHYGSELIPLDAGENEMCSKVSEVMRSLFTGLHTEFMSVAGDVLRIIRNLETLKEFISASYKKQVELISSSGDPQLTSQSRAVDEFYQRLNGELERQLAVLSNLINVAVRPTGKSLISLLEDNGDFSGMVRDLRSDLGTNAFGDRLASLVSGVSSVAHSAELIDKALKRIGMSVNEFKATDGIQDLRLKIYDHIQRKAPSSKELDAMMAAAEIIYKNDYSHKAVAALLSKKENTRGGDNSDSDDSEVRGGDDDQVMGGADYEYDDVYNDDGLTTYWSKKSLRRKISKKAKYRDMMLKDFRKVLQSHYRKIIDAANEIGSRIGTSIPVNDDLDKFIQVFRNLESLNEENLHIALSGYAKDAVSREKRDLFLAKYTLLNTTIEPLLKGQGAPYFKAIQQAVDDLIVAIDNFSDRIVKSLSAIHVDRPSDLRNELKKTANRFFGSAEGGVDLGSGNFVAFEKVQTDLNYYYSIATVKTNLSVVAEDMKEFGDDYEQILGEEAGWLIDQITREYQALIDDASRTASANASPAAFNMGVAARNAGAVGVVGGMINALTDGMGIAGPNALGEDEKNASADNLRDLYTRQMRAKIQMVKAAQAVDMYLRSFADGIARHPDSIKSVIDMLTQVEIVVKWFTDRSGDNLSTLFEFFPCGMDGGTPIYSSGDANFPLDNEGKLTQLAVEEGENKHYYQWIETKIGDGGAGGGPVPAARYPGNPFLGRPLPTVRNGIRGILVLAEKTVKSMRALENILSAFSSVGTKFGDLDPQSKTFMKPGQIFNILCEYITCSAFTTGFLHDHRGDLRAGEAAAVFHGPVEQIRGNIGVDFPTGGAGRNRYRVPTATGAGNNIAGGRLEYADELAQLQNVDPAVFFNTNGAEIGGANYGCLTGIANAAGQVNAQYRRRTSLALSAVPDDSRDNYWTYHNISTRDRSHTDTAGWLDRFYDTDLLFLMTVKSISAKIFTVVDAYRLFHRPLNTRNSHLYDSLNPLRTILGGADGGVDGGTVIPAKVIPEAIELYLRLPLLAEWYRSKYSIFQPNAGAANNTTWRLSLVPNIDGVWSTFMELIFDKISYVEQGNYTDAQVKQLVDEINDIYKHFKSKYPNATTRSIMNSFVQEINRAFGFIQRQDINAYVNDRRQYLRTPASTRVNDVFAQPDILDSENQYNDGPAPSDKFTTTSARERQRRNRSLTQLQEQIVNLRAEVDAEFRTVTTAANRANTPVVNFVETLRTYTKDLSAASSESDKFKVVCRLMQGTNLSQNSPDKVVMLHETVIAPLAVLYNVYKVLAKFNALIHGVSLVNISSWSRRKANAGGVNSDGPVTYGNVDGDVLVVAPVRGQIPGLFAGAITSSVRDGYLRSLTLEYKNDSVSGYNTCVQMANMAIGMPRYVDDPSSAGNTYLTQANARGGGVNLTVADVNGYKILRDLLSAVLDLCANNKLVSCNISTNGSINVDYSTLEELATTLLQQVKRNINHLRLDFISQQQQQLLSRYESREFSGSVQWLEENLVEVLFKDRDRCGLQVGLTEHLQVTFEMLANRRGIQWTAADPVAGAMANFPNLGDAFRELIYYGTQRQNVLNDHVTNDLTTFPFNVLPVAIEDSLQTTEQKRALQGLKNRAAVVPAECNAVVTVPVIAFDSPETLNAWNMTNFTSKSLMKSFNKMVHLYLYDHFDDNVMKIYTPLFESFMNSAAAREVSQDRSFPNVNNRDLGDNRGQYGTPFDRATDENEALDSPADGCILYASIALTMKALITNIDLRMRQKKHVFQSLAEVPEYMRERMKCNLPHYSKMFNLVYERSELLKRLLTNTGLNARVMNIAAGGGGDPRLNGVPNRHQRPGIGDQLQDLTSVAIDADRMTRHFLSLLNHLSELALSIKKCSDSVYKELQDVAPYFMETSKDFIVDYKQRHGVLPLMPASHVLLPQLSMNGRYDVGGGRGAAPGAPGFPVGAPARRAQAAIAAPAAVRVANAELQELLRRAQAAAAAYNAAVAGIAINNAPFRVVRNEELRILNAFLNAGPLAGAPAPAAFGPVINAPAAPAPGALAAAAAAAPVLPGAALIAQGISAAAAARVSVAVAAAAGLPGANADSVRNAAIATIRRVDVIVPSTREVINLNDAPAPLIVRPLHVAANGAALAVNAGVVQLPLRAIQARANELARTILANGVFHRNQIAQRIINDNAGGLPNGVLNNATFLNFALNDYIINGGGGAPGGGGGPGVVARQNALIAPIRVPLIAAINAVNIADDASFGMASILPAVGGGIPIPPPGAFNNARTNIAENLTRQSYFENRNNANIATRENLIQQYLTDIKTTTNQFIDDLIPFLPYAIAGSHAVDLFSECINIAIPLRRSNAVTATLNLLAGNNIVVPNANPYNALYNAAAGGAPAVAAPAAAAAPAGIFGEYVALFNRFIAPDAGNAVAAGNAVVGAFAPAVGAGGAPAGNVMNAMVVVADNAAGAANAAGAVYNSIYGNRGNILGDGRVAAVLARYNLFRNLVGGDLFNMIIDHCIRLVQNFVPNILAAVQPVPGGGVDVPPVAGGPAPVQLNLTGPAPLAVANGVGTVALVAARAGPIMAVGVIPNNPNNPLPPNAAVDYIRDIYSTRRVFLSSMNAAPGGGAGGGANGALAAAILNTINGNPAAVAIRAIVEPYAAARIIALNRNPGALHTTNILNIAEMRDAIRDSDEDLPRAGMNANTPCIVAAARLVTSNPLVPLADVQASLVAAINAVANGNMGGQPAYNIRRLPEEIQEERVLAAQDRILDVQVIERKNALDVVNAEYIRASVANNMPYLIVGGDEGGIMGGDEIDQINWSLNDEQQLMFPTRVNGSNSYKFNLASRLLLARLDIEPKLDHMPGAKEIYDNYMTVSQKNSFIPLNEYTNTVLSMVKLSRFLNDGAVYGKLFDNYAYNDNIAARPNTYISNSIYTAVLCESKHIRDVYAPLDAGAGGGGGGGVLAVEATALCNIIFRRNNIPAIGAAPGAIIAAFNAVPANRPYENNLRIDVAPYQFRHLVSDVMTNVENTNKQASKELFINFLGANINARNNNSRVNMRVYNILDMGIVPINVHAFMKEVAFVNILNYSYTFDRMVHDFIVPNYLNERARFGARPGVNPINQNDIMIKPLDRVASTREMLVKLLVHPYSVLGRTSTIKGEQYYSLIAALFNGADNMRLGRPRYLSDQLWHKALLTSSVQAVPGQYAVPPVAPGPAPAPGAANYFNTRNLPKSDSGVEGYEAMRRAANFASADIGGIAGNIADAARPRSINSYPVATEGLKYYNRQERRWVVTGTPARGAAARNNGRDTRPADVAYCAEVGFARFNTKLVRNLTWMVQLQRIIRVVLINHLSYLDTDVVTGLKIADPTVTEYHGNDAYTDDDFNGNNYTVV